MHPDTRNKIIIGVLVGTIGFVAIIYLFSHSAKCELVKSVPTVTLDNIPKLIEKDNKTLVELAGMIKIAENTTANVFLPLEFESVNVNTTDSNKRLSLKGPCVELTFNFTQSTEMLTVTSIEVSRTQPNGNIEKCTVAKEKLTGFSTVVGKHYSCKSAKFYDCAITTKDKDGKDAKKVIANLTLLAIEFEVVDESNEKIGTGNFITPEQNC